MIEADTIDRLVRVKPDGLPVLSMYVNVGGVDRRGLDSQVMSLLDRIRPLTHNGSLNRESRLSVREDIEHIERAARGERWPQGSVGIFSSSGRGMFEEVPLPRPVHDRVVVDATPWVRPMLAVLDEYHRTCVVMISRGSTRVWELYQNEMREATAFRDPTLRKPNYAHGRTESRIHNRAEELAKRHYRRTVDVLDQAFRAGRFDLLVIGGQDHEVPVFLEFLPRDLTARTAGTFAIDAAGATLGDIKSGAESVLKRYEREEEARLVSATLERHAMGGLAAVGLSDCLWAGSVSAVQYLLVREGLVAPGVVCAESGWLAESGEVCALCTGPSRPVRDVADELVTAVIEDGGAIKHVAEGTELDELMLAAQLRFPLPPRP
jgi:peptide subunit release factor 1 (eRF1)